MMIWWYWNFRWRFDWRNGTNAPKVWSEALWSMHCVLRKNGSGTTMFPQMDAWQRFLGGSYNLSLELCVDCTRSGQNGRTLPGSGTYRRNILSPNISGAPLEIRTKGKKIPDWNIYNGSAGPLPYSIPAGREIKTSEEDIMLIPYGCTTLRIAEFPILGKYVIKWHTHALT